MPKLWQAPSSLVTHRGCGGDLSFDYSNLYIYTQEDGGFEMHPAIVCLRCGQWLFGDKDIELLGDEDIETTT